MYAKVLTLLPNKILYVLGKKNARFKFFICGILVPFVFHNLKFFFRYIKHYCIYLHFNSRLSKIRYSTQRLLVFECRKATHVWVGCRKSDIPLSACSYSNAGKRLTLQSVVENPTFDSALARIEFNSTHFSAESNRKLVG